MSVDMNLKLQKYIVVGRVQTVTNLDAKGEDRRKVITEMFIRKPNTTMNGLMVEYEKIMYNEVVGGRGRDVEHEKGTSYITCSGLVDDFIELNFEDSVNETNVIRFVKTYPNKNFMKRDRTTSYHQEIDIAVDGNGNVFQKVDDDDDDDGGMTPTADFTTIPSGTKYLYQRFTADDTGVEFIGVCDVNYWLKNDTMEDAISTGMLKEITTIDKTASCISNSFFTAPDLDAFEKALQADPCWNEDVNFAQLFV